MMVSLIVAVAENEVIGADGKLPWHLPADLKHFKNITSGHSVIMGRKTYDSIGKALPNRRNLVITSNAAFNEPGTERFSSLGDALKACVGEDEVFIIGGGMIFEKAFELDLIDKIYLTTIHENFKGDAFFRIPKRDTWIHTEIEKHGPDEKNPWAYTFLTLERRPFLGNH